jgi:hypothetical protein
MRKCALTDLKVLNSFAFADIIFAQDFVIKLKCMHACLICTVTYSRERLAVHVTTVLRIQEEVKLLVLPCTLLPLCLLCLKNGNGKMCQVTAPN